MGRTLPPPTHGDAGAFLNLRDYYDRGLAVNVDKAVAAFPDLEPVKQHHQL